MLYEIKNKIRDIISNYFNVLRNLRPPSVMFTVVQEAPELIRVQSETLLYKFQLLSDRFSKVTVVTAAHYQYFAVHLAILLSFAYAPVNYQRFLLVITATSNNSTRLSDFLCAQL